MQLLRKPLIQKNRVKDLLIQNQMKNDILKFQKHYESSSVLEIILFLKKYLNEFLDTFFQLYARLFQLKLYLQLL